MGNLFEKPPGTQSNLFLPRTPHRTFMFPRASSLTVLSRGTRYLFRPTHTAIRPSSLSARAFSAVHAAMADTSGITAESLQAKLVSELQADHVEIEDLSGGCGQAFQAVIVSQKFAGKTMLARHRLVNATLKEEIAAIHAWTPKCYTPEQWQATQQ